MKTQFQTILLLLTLLSLLGGLLLKRSAVADQSGYFAYLPVVGRGGINCFSLVPQKDRERFGTIISRNSLDAYALADLKTLGVTTWFGPYRRTVEVDPYYPPNNHYARVIRLKNYDPDVTLPQLAEALVAAPCSLWVIGNEPDRVEVQDDLMPAEYATFYHDLRAFIKERDPSARVATAGIVQPTPLRRRYLDLVLDAYQLQYGHPMPVDVWNIHNMILREEPGAWGAGVPPGVPYGNPNYPPLLTQPDQSDDIVIFTRQILDFRQWMVDNGYHSTPLIVSEYGILVPDYWGFTDERIRTFMYATFDYFLATTNATTGYPNDNNRLVQQWAWYSLDDYEFDPDTGLGFNGSLMDPNTFQLTPLGHDFGNYIDTLGD